VIIWIGASASPKILGDLFGVDDFMKLDPHLVSPI
jgi:protein transport protein SEC24